jgi:hypothetical protein
VTQRRAVIAMLVGTLGALVGVAGAGHAYLREWRRAAAWFSLVIGAGLVLVSAFADPTTVTPETAPTTVTAPIFVLLVFSVIDAYRVGQDPARRGETPPSAADDVEAVAACPSCGRSLDPTMEFCWYCAEPVEHGTGGRPVEEREETATSR